MFDTTSKNEILITSLIYIIFPILMGFSDYPKLEQSEQLFFLFGRSLVIFISLIYFILALTNHRLTNYPLIFYIVGLAYAIHGQYFSPNYWLAMMELNALFPLFFIVKRKLVLILYTGGTSSFCIFFYYFCEKFINNGTFSELFRKDAIIGVVITGVIAFVTYNSLILARIEKYQLSRRFIDTGKSLVFIIHDLKGMITTPTIYASLLQRSFRTIQYTNKEKWIIKQLLEDLNNINSFVSEMTKLITCEFSKKDATINFTRLSDSLKLIKILLKSRLNSIEIVLNGDIEIKIKTEVLNRILINIISNSIEAFSKDKIKENIIKIDCYENVIVFTDNSNSQLSFKSIRELNKSNIYYSTEKPSGSGIGSYIIKSDITTIGGQATFANGKTGMVLTLKFPKESCRIIKNS